MQVLVKKNLISSLIINRHIHVLTHSYSNTWCWYKLITVHVMSFKSDYLEWSLQYTSLLKIWTPKNREFREILREILSKKHRFS